MKMKIQIVGNDILYKGEKVATLEDDHKKSSVVDAFRHEVARVFGW